MPTYDYRCEACEHEFEEFQSITAKPLRKCPECGKPKLKRLIGTGAGIIFKGSGFYQTDYRSDNYKQAAKADSEASKPASSSSESKSTGGEKSTGAAESKPAKKEPASKPKSSDKKSSGKSDK